MHMQPPLLSSENDLSPTKKRKRPHHESCDSDTSAVIQMNQNIKQRILRNHLMLIILINLIQLTAILFTIAWFPWYDDVGDAVNVEQQYGLLFTTTQGKTEMNGFQNENNKEIGGISSFLLFSAGMAVQILQVFQLAWFFKTYPRTSTQTCKILKFKTCRWVSLFLYVGALSYWVIVVFLVQVVSDASNFSGLRYGFWISVVGIIVYVLVSIYFNFLKKNIRKNDLVSNLLLANRTIHSNHSNNHTNNNHNTNTNNNNQVTEQINMSASSNKNAFPII